LRNRSEEPAQLPPEQPPGPIRAQPGAGRDSWSLAARTAASRAARCAVVAQTRTPTRLPVGTSVSHVTLESAFETFEPAAALVVVEAVAAVETVAAVAVTVAASVAGSARAAGAFTVDAWSG